MTTTIVHDTSEAVELYTPLGLYLKPIAKLNISVALPLLKQPGKSISNWEVMERLKSMVRPDQFSTLRISKSTMEFIRFEGEVEEKSLVKIFLSKLDSKTIKLSGFSDILKVRVAEFRIDFPTRHDWDSFFRDAKDMNETLPGERPDTIHLEGLPCKWFASKDSCSEKPSEEVLKKVFETFGDIRNVDIPMLDPYREEMMGRNFYTFSFGGHLNFEAYIQYQEYVGFVKAMNALRGMKLMFKGDDGKAMACNIKVAFDITKHLSDASIKKRQIERQKLQELEWQREQQKRHQKEEEERQKEEERKRKELEEQERERKREEKIKKREQKQKEREDRRNLKKLKKLQAEEQKKLQEKIALEERKLVLAQRNLESIRLIAELLSRAKAVKQQELENQEAEKLRLKQLKDKRKQQEAELRRVEEEKKRALELQRREKELREKLLSNLQKAKMVETHVNKEDCKVSSCGQLKSVNICSSASANLEASTSVLSVKGEDNLLDFCRQDKNQSINSGINTNLKELDGNRVKEGQDIKAFGQNGNSVDPTENCTKFRVSNCVANNHHQDKSSIDKNIHGKDFHCEENKQEDDHSKVKSELWRDSSTTKDKKHKKDKGRHRRNSSSEDKRHKKGRGHHKSESSKDCSQCHRSSSRDRSHHRKDTSSAHRRHRKEKHYNHRGSSERSHRRKSLSKERGHQWRSVSKERSG
ncbi:A-kinase anchor protein 17A [Latimeria chalumnae]|uniref:A-kinase anchoring protein 17A n=1 Tax=Latimeria chalumnae TaxID=7897 RepID=H3B576_LATCH|nr:PREDICTED: A-kinase anchor protein 17A [Latimeria chalumnae]|eukprot:XP_005999954.1 PREDICTED: A-kinase anchor protein 17A [Latimeria chalumnae]